MPWMVVLPVIGVVFPAVVLDTGLDAANLPVDNLEDVIPLPGACGCLTIGGFDALKIGTAAEFAGLLER